MITRLEAVTGVTDLVGTRIYPNLLPQSPTYPALTYQQVSGPRIESLQGHSGLAHPRFEFNAFAETYIEARDIIEQVRLALEGFSGTVDSVDIDGINLLDSRDFFEDSLGVHRRDMDFEVWHHEAVPA